MLAQLTRHDIQILRLAGVEQEKIRALTGASIRTIRRIQKEAPVKEVDATCERGKRRLGRPAKVEPFRGFVIKLLADEPGIMSLEILRQARLKGYEGRKSALYALIASLRPPQGGGPQVAQGWDRDRVEFHLPSDGFIRNPNPQQQEIML